jgi:hypothetical protein
MQDMSGSGTWEEIFVFKICKDRRRREDIIVCKMQSSASKALWRYSDKATLPF